MSSSETNFKPTAVHDYFIEITKRPHPTANQDDVKGNEDPVREYVVEVAKQLGVEVVFYEKDATEPGKRVIVLRRPGSGQFAGKTPVILQAHMDMVYNPADMEFPLEVILAPNHTDGKWIKARDKQGRDCTLGADDGIGVATALGILKDDSLKEYPIECLFTVQEETDMGGAQNCDVNNLTGDKLLNLDAETLTQIIYGSAGGNETSFAGKVKRMDYPENYVTRKVSISGLKGGHSGVDINKGRVNAFKALGQALARLNSRITQIDEPGGGIGSYDFLVCDIKRNDVIKANAIPAAVEALITLPKEDAKKFDNDFKSYCETLKIQSLRVETGFTYAVEEPEVRGEPLDENSTNVLLCLLQQIPSGVLDMIPGNPAVVQASSNLFNAVLEDGMLTISSSNRSSDEEALKIFNDIQCGIGKFFGFEVKTGIHSYPSWEPKITQLLEDAKNVYMELYKGDYEATVIHAGLECGVLAVRFKEELGRELQAISIGPSI
ncbi:MAG: aminoacyl-histidine dipeptidase, partial [bacterium]|nr:aminoacyl-histidine dipeptidase [bacterium]